MKRLKLFQAVISSIVLLSVFLLQSSQLKAQGSRYESPVSNTLYGTSDSRLTATIKQTGNQVTMTVGAVGVVVADAFDFNVLFNPDSLQVTNALFQPIADVGTVSVYPSIAAALQLEPALINGGFTVSPSTAIRNNGSYILGGTGHSIMRSIDALIRNVEIVGNTKISINSADFVPLYTLFFEKTNGSPLTPDAIGFNIRTAAGAVRAIRWIYEGGSISYDRTQTFDEFINPNLFSFRSPSSVQTKAVTGVAGNLAIFNGMFKRGELPPAFNLLDSVANTPRNTGKLLNDSIVRYGFFYTESNIDITFTEYSDSISINGKNYLFPTDAMIAQGWFVAGTDTIMIAETGTASSARTQDYADTVTGLKSNNTYYMWAFAQYVFETSKPYPLIGIKQTFTTSQTLNLASVFAADDPTCGNADGKIQVHVMGGSGSFQYSLDGVNYADYPDGLITGLAAGSYRIYVRDAYDTLYPTAVSGEIILRNPTSDLFVDMAVTNASNCVQENGILHVSAGGGMLPYTYTLNGVHDTVIEGMIAGLKAGVYVLNVTDALGCSAASGEVRIGADGSLFALTVDSATFAECNENTGAIYFKVAGADYYKYQLDGMSVIAATTKDQIVLTDLNAGVHTLRVFDTCGGEDSQTIYINNGEINGFAVAHAVENVKIACNGKVTEGTITLTTSNGAPNYKYTIDGENWTYFPAGTNTVTIENLSEGVYYVQVMDTNGAGCTYEINTIVIERETPTPLNILASYSSKEPACGNANGEIQIYATGGSGSYKYSVNNASFQNYTDGLISGLGAGTYTIKVQDANDANCAAAQSEDIVLHNSGSDLNISIVAADASSCVTNAGDGALYVSVSGGNGNYAYTWADGTTANVVDGKIGNLPVGVYVLNVSDGQCLATSGEVRIGSNASNLALQFTDSTSTICGSSVGTATFKVTGSADYSYQLDGTTIVTPMHNNPIMLNGLNAGVHTLRVFDNCTKIVRQIVITNGETGGLAFAAEIENEILSCDGSVIPGNIFLTVSNGTPDYKYIIDGSEVAFAAGKDTATIPNLSEGMHYVQVVDNTGCVYEMNTIIIKREKLPLVNVNAAYIAQNPTNCNAKDGEIQLYATGGSGEYLYSTDGGSTFNEYTNGLIAGLGAGAYKILVQDKNFPACTPAQSAEIVLINNNSDLAIEATPYSASTCDANDGILYVSASGGNGQYAYTWADGTTANVVDGKIENLYTGIYTINVTSDGCFASSGEVRIASDASVLAINKEVTSHTICGESIGAVKFTVTSNSTPTEYWYQIDGMPIVAVTHNNPITLSGLNAGVHTLRVYDYCDEKTEEFIITNGENGLAFTADAENVKIACNGDEIEGKIFLTVSNGAMDYVCFIDGVQQNFAAGKDTLTLFVGEGVHYVRVEDNTGCAYEWNNIVIGREKLPLVNVGTIYASINPTCASNGEIQFYVNGGSGQYEYKYSKDGGNLSNVFNYTNGSISNLAAGSYKIYVWDANYPVCDPAVTEDVVLINDNSNFAVTVTADSASDCIANNGILYVSVSGGSGSYNYKLNGIAEAPVNGQYTKPAGVYVVEVTDNGNSCVTSSGEVRINAKTSTLAIAVNDIIHTNCNISTGAVKFSVTGSNAYSYQIDGLPKVNVTGNDPIALNGLSAGVHTLRVFDNCGEVSQQFTITNSAGNLAFTAEVDNLGCNEERNIVLSVTNGTAPYKFSIDKGITWSNPEYSTTIVINDVAVGTYDVLLQDAAGCKYEYTQIRIEAGGLIAPPSATTPQTFCSGAVVADLQATGTGIKWYLSPNSGIALSSLHPLDSGVVYYAAQTIGACESKTRTAVKALINEDVMLDAPSIAFNQSFCNGTALTLADIATNGNTNIVWYDRAVGGMELPLTTPLTDATSYFAAQAAGSCQSAIRAEVHVTFGANNPDSAVIASPQYFCEGAVIANIAVPHNQIVWYTEKTGGNLLTEETVLRDGGIYYAAYKTGSCESVNRTPVQVYLTTPQAPSAPSPQTVCGGATILADLMVTGSGIVWYASDNSTTPLSPNTPLVVGETYYAAQSSIGCEGDRAAIRITDSCFTIKGTVFPFVYTQDEKFDTLFPIIVKLYDYPTSMDCDDPLASIYDQTQRYITKAMHHDGSEWIPNTPKNPGTIGLYNNPGLPIEWSQIGKVAGTPDYRLLVKGIDTIPEINATGGDIGKYALENVAPGKYLLVISRQGYMTRIGTITVTSDGNVGHRELIPGEVDGDFIITSSDESATKARFSEYPEPKYNPRYDLNGDGAINGEDLDYIKANNSAFFIIYKETYDWFNKECK